MPALPVLAPTPIPSNQKLFTATLQSTYKLMRSYSSQNSHAEFELMARENKPSPETIPCQSFIFYLEANYRQHQQDGEDVDRTDNRRNQISQCDL